MTMGSDDRPQLSSITVRLADVSPERVEWLWPGRLPLGKIVILDGDPSVGKSTLSIDCAARVSTGRTWPDGAPNVLGAVLLLSAEDGLADTIRPRLDAAGGDPTRVHAVTEVRHADESGGTQSRPVTLADLADIEQAVAKINAVLVVIDVLMAYLPSGLDAHKDQDVRRVLSGLAAMAERNHCCVLLLRHLNKSAGASALYRGGGSIGIIGAARVGMLAAPDPDDSSRRVLAGLKSNLAEMPVPLGYRLVDSADHGCARVEWLGATRHTAADLLAAPHADDERTDRDEAGEWLLAHLADCGGEAPSSKIKEAARREGISERTLKRAKDAVGVAHYSTGTVPRRTYWRGPTSQLGHANTAPDEVAQLRQGGPTEDPKGPHTGRVIAAVQSGHGSIDTLAPCGHPLKATNTANGKCAHCILAALSAISTERAP